MVVRTVRTRDKSGDRWRQIGISACVLLLPPIAIGAAAYMMLPAREDGGGPAAMAVAEVSKEAPSVAAATAQPPVFELASQTPFTPVSTGVGASPRKDPARVSDGPGAPAREIKARPVAPPPPAVIQTPAANRAPAAIQVPPPGAVTAAPETQAQVSAQDQSVQKDLARMMGPVPVRVTVLTAPKASRAGRPSDDAQDITGTASPPSATLDDSANRSARMAIDLLASGRVAHPAHHLRKHFARHGGRHSASRDESGGDGRPRSFSLRNWLLQLGSRQRSVPQRG